MKRTPLPYRRRSHGVAARIEPTRSRLSTYKKIPMYLAEKPLGYSAILVVQGVRLGRRFKVKT